MTKICVPVACERITHGGEPTSRADPLESCHLRLLLHQPSNRDAHCNILAACTGTNRRTCRMTDPESSVKGQVVKREDRVLLYMPHHTGHGFVLPWQGVQGQGPNPSCCCSYACITAADVLLLCPTGQPAQSASVAVRSA